MSEHGAMLSETASRIFKDAGSSTVGEAEQAIREAGLADVMVREADGAFRFVDRIKDAIRRRGENISSWEVEQVLMSHAAVAACAVYPVRSELAEDEVMAAVVVRADVAVDAPALAQWCDARLPKFAVPRYIDLVAELPRTENGKVQKYKLREQGVTPATRDRHVLEHGARLQARQEWTKMVQN